MAPVQREKKYTLQVAVEDCTGCELCVEVCPAKDKQQANRKALNMVPQIPVRDAGKKHWDFFLDLPETSRYNGDDFNFSKVKDVQLLDPLFEFSSACAGCGETPYLRLLSQLYGDRLVIGNATGCSSIYGGNLPTTPWTQNAEGRGPAWNNSLFEDNAEFGLGFRLALDKQKEYGLELVDQLRGAIGDELADGILKADQSTDRGIGEQRKRVAELKKKLESQNGDARIQDLLTVAESLVDKSVWIVGGDGWAYDIGYGGLDHVLASGRNVNLLVLDTEVYSNTGGQASKATGLGAVAKFAAGGKGTPKKDLGMLAMSYGYVYVAQIAMGANENQTIKAFQEAAAFDGPSIILAYSQCIAHGIDMVKGMEQQDLATNSGYWPLYRFDPRLRDEGKNPFQLDSKKPKVPLKDYIYREARYKMLTRSRPEAASTFLEEGQKLVDSRWRQYERLAKQDPMAEAAVEEAGGAKARPGGPPPPGGPRPAPGSGKGARPAPPPGKMPPSTASTGTRPPMPKSGSRPAGPGGKRPPEE